MRKRFFEGKRAAVILAAAVCALLTACGQASEGAAEDGTAAKTDSAQAEEKKEDAAKEDTAKKEDTDKDSGGIEEDVKKAIGEWEFIYTKYHSDYNDGESYDYITMCTDPDSPASNINIREENGKAVIDYKYDFYESRCRYFGHPLEYKKQAAYEGCENDKWSMEIADPFAEDDQENDKKMLTMLDDETLIVVDEYESDEPEGSEYYFHSVSIDTYIRKDSPRLENKEELRYFDTVTVSDATELLNSIQNNRKVILEAGEYNLSKVNEADIKNDAYKGEYSYYSVSGISNFCIEAKEGADVSVVIDDPYEAVLSFESGSNITLRNLTVGHKVEKGYCSGSVVRFSGITGINIDKCNLYGSGTYGIEADSSSYMEVTDSDIYECTYGLVDLSNISTVHFKDCKLRDSEDMSMIVLDSAYDVIFENCSFTGNNCAYDSNYFIQKAEYDDVTFKGCEFNDNQYYVFSNYEVKMEDCKMENNNARYSDIINYQEIDDGSDL
ncbi:MAG: right-handed parallel beta-helix repeat-containing protein, partial [Lachnospiraceae bacterium]|nr:right-handed parallel beta-helix repeat-containing protein [Lachnospiraceae bacterium]